MPSQKEIVLFLDRFFNIEKTRDTSINGLQVDSGNRSIKKVAFAVDACIESFEKAKQQHCDMVIVHHGLFWNEGIKSVKGNTGARIRHLLKDDLSLYAVHLPLDLNPKIGNNINLCNMLGMKHLQYFAPYHGTKISIFGKIPPTDINNIAKKLDSELKTKSIIFNFGTKRCSTIGICSGSGTYALDYCKDNNIDTLVTGEMKHGSFHVAKEEGINIIASGHYATERHGLLSLMKVLSKRFPVQVVMIESPTGL